MANNDNIEKKTLNFRAGDWDYITSVFGPQGVFTSTVVRSLVSKWVDEHAKGVKQDQAAKNPEVDL